MLSGHGGRLPPEAISAGMKPDEIIDFSVSVNPRLNSDALEASFKAALSSANRYPDPHYAELRQAIAVKYGLSLSNIIVGNGSTELIYLIPRALSAKSALVVAPSYADYADSLRIAGATAKLFFLYPSNSFKLDENRFLEEVARVDMVILGNPNNPTGSVIEKRFLLRAAEKNPNVWFVIDESFADFCPELSLLGELRPNLIIVRSLTKFYGIPGLRIGFAAAHANAAGKILELKEPWTVNCVAENFVINIFTMNGPDADSVERKTAEAERLELFKNLSGIKQLEVFGSRANFLLVRTQGGSFTARELQRELLKYKILIRDCSNFAGLDESYFRIGVRTAAENAQLFAALRTIFTK